MMRSYECEGITVQIGAELISVQYEGKTITPKEIKQQKATTAVKNVLKEFWSNSYFKKRTKTHITFKVAELASRFIGGAALYQLAKKNLEPYLPQIMDCLKYVYNHVDWGSFAFHCDVGFAIGVALTYFMFGRRKVKRG